MPTQEPQTVVIQELEAILASHSREQALHQKMTRWPKEVSKAALKRHLRIAEALAWAFGATSNHRHRYFFTTGVKRLWIVPVVILLLQAFEESPAFSDFSLRILKVTLVTIPFFYLDGYLAWRRGRKAYTELAQEIQAGNEVGSGQD